MIDAEDYLPFSVDDPSRWLLPYYRNYHMVASVWNARGRVPYFIGSRRRRVASLRALQATVQWSPTWGEFPPPRGEFGHLGGGGGGWATFKNNTTPVWVKNREISMDLSQKGGATQKRLGTTELHYNW